MGGGGGIGGFILIVGMGELGGGAVCCLVEMKERLGGWDEVQIFIFFIETLSLTSVRGRSLSATLQHTTAFLFPSQRQTDASTIHSALQPLEKQTKKHIDSTRLSKIFR